MASVVLVILSVKGLLFFQRLFHNLYWLSCLFADRFLRRRTQHVRLRWTIFVSVAVCHMFLAPGVTAVSRDSLGWVFRKILRKESRVNILIGHEFDIHTFV